MALLAGAVCAICTLPVSARDATVKPRALLRPPAGLGGRAHAAEESAEPATDNTYCDACEYIIDEIAADGCSLACEGMPPPADAVCAWMVKSTGLCAWVVQELSGGVNATTVCAAAGLCGGPCECGVCTPRAASASAGRCLGLPYSCGHAAHALHSSDSAGTRGSGARDGLTFCAGDACDGTNEADYGCCLTCL